MASYNDSSYEYFNDKILKYFNIEKTQKYVDVCLFRKR